MLSFLALAQQRSCGPTSKTPPLQPMRREIDEVPEWIAYVDSLLIYVSAVKDYLYWVNTPLRYIIDDEASCSHPIQIPSSTGWELRESSKRPYVRNATAVLLWRLQLVARPFCIGVRLKALTKELWPSSTLHRSDNPQLTRTKKKKKKHGWWPLDTLNDPLPKRS